MGIHGLPNYKIRQCALPGHLQELSHHHEKSHSTPVRTLSGQDPVASRAQDSVSHPPPSRPKLEKGGMTPSADEPIAPSTLRGVENR